MPWTISRQIIAGYLVSLLFLLVLGVTTFSVSSQLFEALRLRLISSRIITQVDGVLTLVQDAETGQRGYLLTGADRYLAPYNNAREGISTAIGELKKTCSEEGYGNRLDDLPDAIQLKMNELQETIDLKHSGNGAGALEIVMTDRGKNTMDRIRQVIGKIKEEQSVANAAANKKAEELVATFSLIIFGGIPLSALIMLIAGWITARSISRPVTSMASAAQRIAEGNLDVAVTKTSHLREVRTLATAFASMVAALRQSAALSEKMASGDLTVNITPLSEADVVGRSQAGMVRNLSDLIEQVQRSGVQVNSSAVQIAATSRQQQTTASEMASTTTEISATAKEMSANATELLKAADNVNAVSQQLAGLAISGKEGLTRMEQVMKHITEASTSITARLGEMNDRAGNISSVVTTITKIADQTNLLSLNAAIEAEKAGEYGRGFSVVASEIRRLADQTAASTLDIEQMVREMLGSVSAGVMGMDKFSEEIRRNAREVGDVSGQIDEMIEQVQSLAPSVESVYEGMRAQTQGSGQISDALSQLGDAARQTAESVRDSNRAVEQLNDATRGLQTAISKFTLR